MSRTTLPLVVLVSTMFAFLPPTVAGPTFNERIDADHAEMAAMAAPMAVPTQGPLPVHPDHPQAAQFPAYNSSADWKLNSSQSHWTNPDGTITHTHMEAWMPVYAKLPPGTVLTVPCRVQLFHAPAQITQISGPLVRSVTLETGTYPIVGDPMGLVVRNCTAVFDPALSDPTGAPPNFVPVRGWFIYDLIARTIFTDGVGHDTELFRPFYADGDPTVPETFNHIRYGGHMSNLGSPRDANQRAHGDPITECADVFLPVLAPITERTVMPCHGFAYQIDPTFPGPGRVRQVLNADLHNGIAGTLVQSLSDPDILHLIVMDVIFDPATMLDGVNKVTVAWDQCTGAGSASFAAGECATHQTVIDVTKGTVVNPPPPPPPSAVDCAGTKRWEEVAPGKWHLVFTVTVQPANGGASCSVVAAR